MDDIGAIQLAVKVDYKQLTGLIKTTDQTKRAVSLLAKDFARTGDKSQYMSSINKIVMAQNNLSKTSRMSQSAIMSLGAKVVQQTKYTDSLTIATRRLNAAHMASGRAMGNTRNKMNGSNMAVQQLGYQFGDFAVQVQGGTSAFVAFSQQASQLVGVLPMVAGPLGLSMKAAVGLSAAFGILIPIGSALGRMFVENRKAAKGAAEGIISIKDASKEAVKEISKLRGELELLQSGAAGSQELALNKAIFEMYNKIYDLKNKTVDLTYADAETIKAVEDAIEGTSTASQEQLKIYEDQLASLLRQRDAILVNKALAGSEVNEDDNEQANRRRRIREEVEARKKAKDELAKYSSDLADAERLLGEQAVAANVKNIMLTREAETKAREEREKAVLEGIAIFRAANKKAAAEKEELEKRAFNRRFEAEDQLMSMPLKVDKATQKKIDEAVELNRQQDVFLDKQKVQLGIATRISGQTGEELFAAQQINEMVLFKLELDKLELKSGDEKYKQLVGYKELMQEAEARTFYKIQLEKEAAEAKKIADAEAQRVNDILLDQYSRIEQELEDQAQKQKQLADSIANTFGNAFMSIVDGTESAKDAFRSMARDIIKQLYQILVVEKMVNSISGAIQSGFGGGGAPQGPMPSGNPIPHANGGVVGSPTTFPMSGGKTGLMGEAGPEAIMPLKRGANGKLGVQMEGGGATTVVQNFNFSANGDDSVKRIIAQAAPKIAEMTKSQIVNDRKRGGSMKAAFG